MTQCNYYYHRRRNDSFGPRIIISFKRKSFSRILLDCTTLRFYWEAKVWLLSVIKNFAKCKRLLGIKHRLTYLTEHPQIHCTVCYVDKTAVSAQTQSIRMNYARNQTPNLQSSTP